MPSGPLLLYDTVLKGLLTCETPSLLETPITACLLKTSHVADLSAHTRFSDIEADELTARDYKRTVLTGRQVLQNTGIPSFTSDTVVFGDPVTIGPVRYMAFVFGAPYGLKASSPLLGIAELSTGGAVEAQRSAFSVASPESGWFSLARG